MVEDADVVVWPGDAYPLGASFDGKGTNFSIYSENAESVELCLFDEQRKETRIKLEEVTGYCWHGYIADIKPGQRYGYRIFGPWDPNNGQRFNPHKLLLDPYAKAVDGQIKWHEALFPYEFGDELKLDEKDSASFMTLGVVHNPQFDWEGDKKLKIPMHETIIYETHVKGITANHPEIPENLRGTYSGLSQPVMIEYFKSLGITAVELMPVHLFVHDKHLIDNGLRNFWGYNTINFFAPHNEYSSKDQYAEIITEFKQMVKDFHQAGIEVILDVVYNHTAEGNHLGPIFSFKGIDNSNYYRLTEDAQYYMDYTGTGNCLNMQVPHVLQLLMDSLRYWVLEMHVDGFRFDLAAALARELHDVNRLSSFFNLIQQDPVVSSVKLIAEPWDVGEGGYQVGNFPPVWAEWNADYRDCVRDFWRGEERTLGEFASRFTGSSDLYESTSRLPYASINFITAHDGFTLKDMVSFNTKNNYDNGDDNEDGADDNRSWNCGEEGHTSTTEVNTLRDSQRRNFFATLMLSQGVPMISGGDEIGRTQGGNNNAYCQDNEISWYDWENVDAEMLDFCRKLIAYRKSHPAFRRRRWFQGVPIRGSDVEDILWFDKDGKEMSEDEWDHGHARTLGVFMNGKTIPNPNARGAPVVDDNFYLIFNTSGEEMQFVIPDFRGENIWIKDIDTFYGWIENDETISAGDVLRIEPRSMVVLRDVA